VATLCLVGVIAFGATHLFHAEPEPPAAEETISSDAENGRPVTHFRYALRESPVREARGASGPVVRTIDTARRVEVGDFQDGWYAAYDNGQRIGFVDADNLVSDRDKFFQVISSDWRVLSSGSAVRWEASVQNMTDKTRSQLTIVFEFVDLRGEVLASSSELIRNVAPKEVRQVRSFCEPRLNGRAQIRVEQLRHASGARY